MAVIVEGSPATVELYERAVRRFRATGGDPAFLERPDTVVLMAVDADEVVGWCWGHELARPDHSSMMYLHDLVVADGHRGRGLARELLAAFMAAGRRRGAAEMFLTTGQDNAVARPLYEGAGGEPATQGPTVNYWFVLDDPVS